MQIVKGFTYYNVAIAIVLLCERAFIVPIFQLFPALRTMRLINLGCHSEMTNLLKYNYSLRMLLIYHFSLIKIFS